MHESINFFTESQLSLHNSSEQYKKQNESSDVKISKIDIDANTAITNGKYKTSLYDCTCMDFTVNHLPCKHMYKFATKLGLFKSARPRREKELIADFSSGYASEWKVPIPDCFRASLDILLLKSKVKNQKHPSSTPGYEWSQGKLYNFNAWALIYSDKSAYELSWGEALKNLKFYIQITNVIPSFSQSAVIFKDGKLVATSKIVYGNLNFDLHNPNNIIGSKKLYKLECRQDKFVHFLKTEKLETINDIEDIHFN